MAIGHNLTQIGQKVTAHDKPTYLQAVMYEPDKLPF
jgi:hypothetical protein